MYKYSTMTAGTLTVTVEKVGSGDGNSRQVVDRRRNGCKAVLVARYATTIALAIRQPW